MIISRKYKFIFIKTVKTAGTSIEVFLSQVCGKDDIVTPIYPHVAPHVARNYVGNGYKFYNHIPAVHVKNMLPNDIWDSYFKFCVERNPWDKTLSHYHMLNDRAGGKIPINQYFERGQFCLNYPLYTDENGDLLLDRVVKFESLNSDIEQVFDMLKIPFTGTLGIMAKARHRKDRRPYNDVLSTEQQAIIERVFAREIEMHGYTY